MLMFGSAVAQTKPAAPAEVFDAKQNKCSFKLLSQNAKHTLRAFPLWKDNITEADFNESVGGCCFLRFSPLHFWPLGLNEAQRLRGDTSHLKCILVVAVAGVFKVIQTLCLQVSTLCVCGGGGCSA